jgi:hypothetical protein
VVTCTCVPHPYGDGPEIDCTVHGAVCGCGTPIGLHPPTEIVTTANPYTYWVKECLTLANEPSVLSTGGLSTGTNESEEDHDRRG